MRLLRGAVAAVIAAVAVPACSSSGGRHTSSGSLEVRPVIMPAQRATGARADAFGSLQVPADERAYGRSSRAQQTRLASALRGVDCARPPKLTGTAARVVCSKDSYAYLLGAPIFTAHDVTHVTALPSSSVGSTDWDIRLTLTSAGAEKAYEWTSRHHVNSPIGAFNVVQTSAQPPCGAATRTPCSDFLAYVSDDVVVTVPVIFDPLKTFILVSGNFTAAAATKLARTIAG